MNRVVAAITFREGILIFLENGEVWQMTPRREEPPQFDLKLILELPFNGAKP